MCLGLPSLGVWTPPVIWAQDPFPRALRADFQMIDSFTEGIHDLYGHVQTLLIASYDGFMHPCTMMTPLGIGIFRHE